MFGHSQKKKMCGCSRSSFLATCTLRSLPQANRNDDCREIVCKDKFKTPSGGENSMEKPKCIIIIRFTNKNVFFLEIYPRLPLVYSDYGLSIVHCVGRSVIGRRFLTELIGMQITCSFRCSRWWTSTRHSNDAYTQQNHHLNYYMNKTVRSVDCREYKDDHSARHNNKFIIIHSLTFIAGLVLLFFIFLFVILSTQVPFSCCFAVGCYVPYNLARRAARYNSQHSRICHDNDDVDDNDEGRHCRAKRRPTSSRKKKQKKKIIHWTRAILSEIFLLRAEVIFHFGHYAAVWHHIPVEALVWRGSGCCIPVGREYAHEAHHTLIPKHNEF